MTGEAAAFNGRGLPHVSTVVVDNWRGTGKQARMNTSDYDPARDGAVLEGPTVPVEKPGVADPPLFNPKLKRRRGDGSGAVE